MLNKIIMHEGLVIDQNLQPKCGFLNKRNKNNNVGNGIYLSPNISIVEQKTGIVFLDDKAYKIALDSAGNASRKYITRLINEC